MRGALLIAGALAWIVLLGIVWWPVVDQVRPRRLPRAVPPVAPPPEEPAVSADEQQRLPEQDRAVLN